MVRIPHVPRHYCNSYDLRRRLRTFPSRSRLVTAAVPLPKLTRSLKGITAKKVNATRQHLELY